MQYAKSAKLMRQLRKRTGLSQKAFAIQLGWKSPQYISMVEKGRAGIPIHIMPILSDRTQISLDKILRAHLSDTRLILQKAVGLK